MAVKKAKKKTKSTAKKKTTKPAQQAMSRPQTTRLSNPFAAMRRLSDEMEELFHGAGLGNLRFPLLGRDLDLPEVWGPDVDVLERKGSLVVRADLPGMDKDDVKVDITESNLTISGERKSEKKEEKEGFYRSERSYGSFRRTIALPDGVKTDRAKASFKDGVLEVTMPTVKTRAKSGRRLAIKP